MAGRMKNPPHPCGSKKTSRRSAFRSPKQRKGWASRDSQLHLVVKGQHAITPEMAMRLEKAFGGSADLCVRMQMSFDLAELRKYPEAIKVKPLEPKVA